MIGRIAASRERALWIKASREYILEMPVLLAEVPAPWRPRRIRRVARLLRKQGVKRVLTPEEFPYRNLLEEGGLSMVETGEFCRCLAAPVCMAALHQAGISPLSATVVLRGERVTRAMRMSALSLCPRVKNLLIAAPVGGAGLQAELRREYGVPVLEDGGFRQPDAALHFSPASGAGKVVVDLSGPFPALKNFIFRQERGELPENCASLPLLAALWEAGRLNPEDITVFEDVHS